MPDFERVTITIEPDLLRRLDEAIQSRGHGNRSEAIRDLIRSDLVTSAGPDVVVAASLTVVFDHGRRALSDRLVAHAHDHHDLVLSTLHVHLDADLCMEVSALRGTRSAVEHYAAHARGVPGVLTAQLVVAADDRA
jgi:CopG family nickel-responsive transcriptional regulator